MDMCNFCEQEIPKGTGKLYVKKDGKMINFCSNKCHKITQSTFKILGENDRYTCINRWAKGNK